MRRIAGTAIVQQRPRYLVVGETDGFLEGYVIGQRMHGVGGSSDVFGVAAATLFKVARTQQHFPANRHSGDLRARGFDISSHIVAGVGR